jgi:hypothetical protein
LLKARTVEPEKQPLLAYGSESTFVTSKQPQINRFSRQQSVRNSGCTVGNGVFYGGPCRGVIRRTNGVKIQAVGRGATIYRELKHGSRGIAIVGAITRQLLVNTLQAGKDFTRALVICKAWSSVMAI